MNSIFEKIVSEKRTRDQECFGNREALGKRKLRSREAKGEGSWGKRTSNKVKEGGEGQQDRYESGRGKDELVGIGCYVEKKDNSEKTGGTKRRGSARRRLTASCESLEKKSSPRADSGSLRGGTESLAGLGEDADGRN